MRWSALEWWLVLVVASAFVAVLREDAYLLGFNAVSALCVVAAAIIEKEKR